MHIYGNEESRKYFELQFRDVGMVATSYYKSLCVPCLQYIDDRRINRFCNVYRIAQKTPIVFRR